MTTNPGRRDYGPADRSLIERPSICDDGPITFPARIKRTIQPVPPDCHLPFDMIIDPYGLFFCFVCGTNVPSGTVNLHQHVNGKRHMFHNRRFANNAEKRRIRMRYIRAAEEQRVNIPPDAVMPSSSPMSSTSRNPMRPTSHAFAVGSAANNRVASSHYDSSSHHHNHNNQYNQYLDDIYSNSQQIRQLNRLHPSNARSRNSSIAAGHHIRNAARRQQQVGLLTRVQVYGTSASKEMSKKPKSRFETIPHHPHLRREYGNIAKLESPTSATRRSIAINLNAHVANLNAHVVAKTHRDDSGTESGDAASDDADVAAIAHRTSTLLRRATRHVYYETTDVETTTKGLSLILSDACNCCQAPGIYRVRAHRTGTSHHIIDPPYFI